MLLARLVADFSNDCQIRHGVQSLVCISLKVMSPEPAIEIMLSISLSILPSFSTTQKGNEAGNTKRTACKPDHQKDGTWA